MTNRYQGSDAWREERRTGYGASDAPILVEGDELAWRQLHGEKLGLVPEREASETMDLGKRIEDVVARVAAERLGEPLVRVNRLVRHPDIPYIFASLDRRRKRGDRRPVEIKKWAYKGDEWGPAGSDIVPSRILYQVQQQIAVTGADAVDLFVLFAGAKVEPFTVGRDQTLIDELIGLEVAAWAYVARGEMPPWPGQAPRRIQLAQDEVPVDETLANLIELYETADDAKKRAEKELDDAKDRIRAVLADVGGAKGLLPDGRRVSVAHRPQDPPRVVAWEEVAKAYRHSLETLVGTAQALRHPHVVERIGEGDDIYTALDQAEAALRGVETALTTTGEGRRPLRITIGKQKDIAA